MSDTSADRRQAWRSTPAGARLTLLVVLSGLALVAALVAPAPLSTLALVGAGAGLVVSAILFSLYRVMQHVGRLGWFDTVRRLMASDPWPSLLTDASGRVTHLNAPAASSFDIAKGQFLGTALSQEIVIADALVARLLDGTTDADHSALETTHFDGVDLTISAQRLDADVILWRLTRASLDQEVAADGIEVPMIAGAPRTGWYALNAAAEKVIGGAAPNRGSGPPEIDGLTPHRVLSSSSGETLLYLPPTAAVPEGEGTKALGDLSTLDTLIHALPVPILRVAGDGVIETANDPARRLLGLGAGPPPPLYEIVEGMGRSVTDWLADAIASKGLLKPEIVRATLPEKDSFVQIVMGRIENETGAHLIGILNDATELKSLEAQFVQSQKMQAIGQLAGGVAHDFNNLLTAISGHCDLLLLRHDQGDPDYSDLKQIAHNANRAASLVGQLLAFSRKQTLKAQPLDLHETMSDLTHLLNRLVGEKVTLTLNIAPLDKVIRADRRGFEQVIMNLVVNARDAMPEGGPVEIAVTDQWVEEDFERDRVIVPAGDYIVVKVCDTGHGIDPERLPKIFEPFYTTKKTGEGTGLGLSTAYGIVKQTGGFIFADSKVGEGTCFILMFPAHSREAVIDTELPLPKRPISATRHHGVVLLVEDEAPVRAFASRALRLRGYTVLEADDAESALDILTDASLHIDVFVTDVIMPGLDGPTWVRQALEDRPDTRVVFVSGYSQEHLAENQARVPNSVFLAKPFTLTQLTDVVHDQMN